MDKTELMLINKYIVHTVGKWLTMILSNWIPVEMYKKKLVLCKYLYKILVWKKVRTTFGSK